MKAFFPLALAAALLISCGGDDNGDETTDAGKTIQDTGPIEDTGEPEKDEGKAVEDTKKPTPGDIVIVPTEDVPKEEDVEVAPPATSCAEAVTCWAHCKLDDACKTACAEGVDPTILDEIKPVQECVGQLNCGGAPVQCLVEDCWDQYHTCYFGGVSGSGLCSDALECIVACPADDGACESACLAKASNEAQKAYVKYTECVWIYAQDNCEGVDPAECKKQAEMHDCGTQFNFCLGDKG